MIETLFQGIISIVINLVNFILTPIDNVILKFLPDLSSLFSHIGQFFNYILNIIPWVVSYLGLSPEILSLISLTLVFKVSASFVIYLTKLAVHWYNHLKL